MRIDLNTDLGESFGAWTMGDDNAMLDLYLLTPLHVISCMNCTSRV